MAKKTVEAWLRTVHEAKGTDLLLSAGVAPWMRIDGDLVHIPGADPLSAADTENAAHELLTPAQRAQLAERGDVDFSFSWDGEARFRGNAFRQRGSIGIAIRLISFEVPTVEELGLPPIVSSFVDVPRGLVLVTGPTGSGKSTTLAALVDRVNSRRGSHILTIEDPIEYVHVPKMSAVHQREVGDDTTSFAQALRSALREDPDVLLVGEMRDLESIQIALTIAETGHLVMASLHTNDTAQALDRIVDVFPAERQQQIRIQLANSLTGIVYQRLLPRINGGLVAAFEVLVATPAVRNLVREGKTNQLRNAVVTGTREGMQTIESSLSELVRGGIVSYEDALARSLYPRDVRTT